LKKDFIDYFLLLEVHILASDEAIKASYRRLSAKYHPDNKGDIEQYHLIQEAYKILSNVEEKAIYTEEWKKTFLSHNSKHNHLFERSIYDLSFNSVRESGNEYMFLIMNNAYELAYDLLSQENRSKLFKKDFIEWQRLIGQVHELLEFDTIVDTFNQSKHIRKFVKSDYKIVTLRIRIVEMNLLLNRIEEDFFSRDMVYEDFSWKVLLPNLDIKNIIKKYKQILMINKKNQKLYKRRKVLLEDRYLTKKLSIDSFMNNAEYEFLRYERYNRTFSMMLLKEKEGKLATNITQQGEQYIELNTRKLDSYCLFQEDTYLVLLPETGQEGIDVVLNKMAKFQVEFQKDQFFDVKAVTINSDYKSLKDLINRLVVME